ncbi:MAG: hypothetical protein HY578_05680 [Nitrospinae bacterium]|nr:hypothetical protein [Nitrospinota bacterium]
MSFWERVKRNLQKGIKEGIEVMKGGAVVVKRKAGELTEEGKRRYRIFELNKKVHREMAELGGIIYDLSSRIENPMLSGNVKEIIARIKKLEEQIKKLEEKQKTLSR